MLTAGQSLPQILSRSWLAGALVLGLYGCTAILDFSKPIGEETDKVDASTAPDDATPAVDAIPAVCTTFEPNDTRAEAEGITPTDLASAICFDTDTDIYAFAVALDQDVSITLSFGSDAGHDIELELLDADGGVIIRSAGDTNTEQIIRSKALTSDLAPGSYFISVVPAVVTDLVAYNLNLTITPN